MDGRIWGCTVLIRGNVFTVRPEKSNGWNAREDIKNQEGGRNLCDKFLEKYFK